jgi:hypothetical protein
MRRLFFVHGVAVVAVVVVKMEIVCVPGGGGCGGGGGDSHTRCTHLVAVENQVQLTHALEALVQALHKDLWVSGTSPSQTRKEAKGGRCI